MSPPIPLGPGSSPRSEEPNMASWPGGLADVCVRAPAQLLGSSQLFPPL